MRKLKILVIDDAPEVAKCVRSQLRYIGDHEISLVSDGQEGIEFIKKHDNLDLVITDRRMPGMLGEEVVRFINLHYPKIKIVLMSADDPQEMKSVALAAGADDFLEKPFKLQDLKDLLKKFFGKEVLKEVLW